MISAIVLIHAESAKIPQVAQSIAEIPGIERIRERAGEPRGATREILGNRHPRLRQQDLLDVEAGRA